MDSSPRTELAARLGLTPGEGKGLELGSSVEGEGNPDSDKLGSLDAEAADVSLSEGIMDSLTDGGLVSLEEGASLGEEEKLATGVELVLSAAEMLGGEVGDEDATLEGETLSLIEGVDEFELVAEGDAPMDKLTVTDSEMDSVAEAELLGDGDAPMDRLAVTDCEMDSVIDAELE